MAGKSSTWASSGTSSEWTGRTLVSRSSAAFSAARRARRIFFAAFACFAERRDSAVEEAALLRDGVGDGEVLTADKAAAGVDPPPVGSSRFLLGVPGALVLLLEPRLLPVPVPVVPVSAAEPSAGSECNRGGGVASRSRGGYWNC